MKKLVLLALLIAGGIGVGLASTGWTRPSVSFTPHMIVYRVITYDESENVAGTEIMVRRVTQDGTWNHSTIRSDGSVVRSSGQLTGPITNRTTDSDSPKHLGYAYYADLEKNPAWICPDLQDFLMFTAIRDDGKKSARIEAVEISKL
jgi:hypothetical protein